MENNNNEKIFNKPLFSPTLPIVNNMDESNIQNNTNLTSHINNNQRVNTKKRSFPFSPKLPPTKKRKLNNSIIFLNRNINTRKLLSTPLEIPNDNMFSYSQKITTLSNGIPYNIINTHNIPTNILNNIPKDIIESIKNDPFVIESFNKQKLLQLIESLNLPKYLYENLQSKFQYIGLIYEIIDEEFYALWLTKVFSHKTSASLFYGVFYNIRFYIYTPDFTIPQIEKLSDFIYSLDGYIEDEIDLSNFIIFKKYQKIDLSDIPHVRPLNKKQLEQYADILTSENDLIFDNIIEDKDKQDDNSINTDYNNTIIFQPSKKYLINQNLLCKQGIPLFLYTQNDNIQTISQNDFDNLCLILNKDIPSSLQDIWLKIRNGGLLRRKYFPLENNDHIIIEQLACIDLQCMISCSLPLLYNELENNNFIPLYKDSNNWLVLDYRNPLLDKIPVIYLKHPNTEKQEEITLALSFTEFLAKLEDPLPYYVYGIRNTQDNTKTFIMNYLQEEFQLFFGRYEATHLQWKNKYTLQRCKFILRMQQGVNSTKIPFEYPNYKDISWILLFEPLHEYYLDKLDNKLQNGPLQAKRIFTPIEE